jgi:tetratricopeptide (TPR) repeat protein
MKKGLCILCWLVGFWVQAQNEQLAEYYYDKGDFEKAKLSFETLAKESPLNRDWFIKTVYCNQQLLQYDVAEKALKDKYNATDDAQILVELGYNNQLQNKTAQAEAFYKKAIESIDKNPNEVYGVSQIFEKKNLLDYALKAYETAEKKSKNYSFNYQKGLIYGQQGNISQMIEILLDEAYKNPRYANVIQNRFAIYMAGETNETFTEMLRKSLLTRVQGSQDFFWNRYLSWFYVQKKDYFKAFIQEKAMYRRQPESLSDIMRLAQYCLDENQIEDALPIFEFVTQNTQNSDVLAEANYYLLKIKIDKAQPETELAIEKELQTATQQFAKTSFGLDLQILKSHFQAFNLNAPDQAIEQLSQLLDQGLNDYQMAQVKMELADVMLLEEKFNQALLYYSQIEVNLKNDKVAHEAGYKAALTSYFKTDFDWALQQFKVLKSASTQLIANDALEYYLLLIDTNAADSTQVALTKLAKADFLKYQNKSKAALLDYEKILTEHPGEDIVPVVLLRMGQLYDKTMQYDNALAMYQKIIDQHPESIYIDEALYFAAEIYYKKLLKPDLSLPLYEEVVIKHPDSIYYVMARTNYRTIRGDIHF